jgi:hypothetical protein
MLLAAPRYPPAMQDDPERERIVDTEPEVLEGDDEFPREPASPLDPYTPEAGPRPGEERAFRVMRFVWIPLLVIAAVILIAALR